MKILQYEATTYLEQELNLAFMIINSNQFTRTLGRDRWRNGSIELLSSKYTQFTYTTP